MAERFKASGPGSKLWFVQQVKAGLNLNEMTKTKGVSFYVAKEALADLAASGHIKNEGKPGGRDRYVVTSFGHRFLERQKSEPDESRPVAKGLSSDNGQPSSLLKRSFEVVKTPEFIPSRTVELDGKPLGGPTVTITEQLAESLDAPELRGSLASEEDDDEDLPAMDTRAIRVALGDLMFDKYADRITAKELIEYLEK